VYRNPGLIETSPDPPGDVSARSGRPAPAVRFHIARLLLLVFVLTLVGIYGQMRRLRARVTERVGWITATQPFTSILAGTTDAQLRTAREAARGALASSGGSSDRRAAARALLPLLSADAAPSARAPRAVDLIRTLRREAATDSEDLARLLDALGGVVLSGVAVAWLTLSLLEAARRREQHLAEALARANAEAEQRERAESALARERHLVGRVLERAPLAFLLLDATGTLLRQNDSARALLGLPDDAGYNLARDPHEDLAALRDDVRSALAGVGDPFGRLQITVGEGEHRRELSLERVAAPLSGERGERAGVLLFLRDASEHRRLLEVARQNERLAALGTLVAGTGHEIRNPLTFVRTNAEWLDQELQQSEQLPPEVRARWRDAVADVLDGAHRIDRVVRDLATLSRDTSGHEASADVAAVVRDALRLLDPKLRAAARVRVDVSPVSPVRGDPARLAQVLVNLLENALHATPEDAGDDAVTVRARPEDPGRVRVEVEDRGGGISPEHAARIFDPFFTTKPVGRGTGLGLSIAHRTVTDVGGEISFAPAPVQGTVFLVILPTSTVSSATAPEASPRVARRMRLLAVDDEPAVLRALGRVLREHAEVHAVGSVDEAEALLRGDDRFDAVLLDVMLPGRSGVELLQTLQHTHPDLARRVVMMTGGALTPEAATLLDTLGDAVLQKPFTRATLLDALAPFATAAPR
jgi:signal transduction histidine kinase